LLLSHKNCAESFWCLPKCLLVFCRSSSFWMLHNHVAGDHIFKVLSARRHAEYSLALFAILGRYAGWSITFFTMQHRSSVDGSCRRSLRAIGGSEPFEKVREGKLPAPQPFIESCRGQATIT
jgi:hypothetical protein